MQGVGVRCKPACKVLGMQWDMLCEISISSGGLRRRANIVLGVAGRYTVILTELEPLGLEFGDG